MATRIKGWAKFQHFKDRRPPWIKLYRDILEDPDWHELDGDTAKTLVAIWLIASEDEEHEGKLPDTRRLAFRLRTTETKVKQQMLKLSHWLEHDDIDLISDRYQDDAPETETEKRQNTESEERHNIGDCESVFEQFWSAYPKKTGKQAAATAFAKIKSPAMVIDQILQALSWQTRSEQWCKDGGQYIPNPATYLNQGRWQDEPVAAGRALNKQEALEARNRQVVEEYNAELRARGEM